VVAGDFGFLTLIQVFDGPERYGASSFVEMPPSPSLQAAAQRAYAINVANGGKADMGLCAAHVCL
jgi:hypothetical protein